MKNIQILLIVILTFAFVSCSQSDSSSSSKVDSLNIVINNQQAEIKALNDTLEMLKFPADQRLTKAIEFINNGNLDEAENLLNQIKNLFPNSQEAKSSDEQMQRIAEKREEILAEQERIKALGFKALSPVSSATIDDVSVSLNAFSTGKDFIHDTYSTYTGSSWRYNTADKGNKYIYCSMTVTSTSSDPNLPTLALYSVQGDKLKHESDFKIEFARWDDYGTYLGNEPDFHNDFSKVNTIKFKLGCEVSEKILANPYVVVLKLANTQVRESGRFDNPPVWYSGNAEYPLTLKVEDFNAEYKAVKIANL